MPPTWIILAFFYTNFKLSLLPVVIVGAVMAMLGRVILSVLARNYLRRFLPKSYEQNYDDLGIYFQQNQKLTIPIVLTYAFLPIPSNQVFIVAGLTKLNMKLISLSFLIGRLVSYSFWISITYHFSTQLKTIFEKHFSNNLTFVLEIMGILIIIALGRITWRKILKIH